MPTFEIPDGPTTVELERSGDAKNPGPATGSVVFNVTNKSEVTRDGGLRVIASDETAGSWFTIEGDEERSFAPGETQTVTIRVSAPKDASAGDYAFRLRAVAVGDPDNDFAEGPAATAKVPPPSVPNGKKWWQNWWIWVLIGLLVLLTIGLALYFTFASGPEKQETTDEGTPPLPVMRMGSLEMGFDRPGLDIRPGETVPNVQACVKLCEATEQCVALTYVFPGPGNMQNGVCWIKHGIPQQVPNPIMISAVKVPAG